MRKKISLGFDRPRFSPLFLGALLATSLCFTGSSYTYAQQANGNQAEHAWSDADLPKPAPTGHAVGYADAGATAMLQAYEKATSGSAWVGMKATGTMTLPGVENPEKARLFMLPGNRLRMEVDTDSGEDRTVTKGSHGFIHYAHDDRGYHDTDRGAHSGPHNVPLSPQMASAGVIPFDLPFAVLQSPVKYAVTDRGSMTVDGIQAERITIETPIVASGFLPGDPRQMVVDCYFDLQTHLLRKMATDVMVPAFGRQQILRVTSYANYQTSGNVTVPFSYGESIEGRTVWSLQLSSADTNNLPAQNIF
jgi:hypothetical protein